MVSPEPHSISIVSHSFLSSRHSSLTITSSKDGLSRGQGGKSVFNEHCYVISSNGDTVSTLDMIKVFLQMRGNQGLMVGGMPYIGVHKGTHSMNG